MAEIRRFVPSFNTTCVQHADFDLEIDGEHTTLPLSSFDFGIGWAKLWIAVNENHDATVSKLLGARVVSIVAHHPDINGEVVRRDIKGFELVRRVIGSTASPNVVQEEIWLCEPGVNMPMDATDVRIKDAILQALRYFAQSTVKQS
jgi:hypothetical protein